MRKAQPYISALMTILIGLIFIISALLKMRSIAPFELYIFSFEIVSLNVAALLARLIIGVELALGIAYLLNIYHRELFYTILSTLVIFTLFLIVTALLGREDNCHCFGSLVDISPTESIFKNLAMMLILALSRRLPEWPFAWVRVARSYILLSLCALAFYPLFKSPPRGLNDLLYGKEGGYAVDVELFEQFIADNPQYEWGERTKAIFFYGVSCGFCKISARQLSHIVRRNKIDPDQIALVFWGDEERVANFYEEANVADFGYQIVDAAELINITKGEFPTMVFYEPRAKHNISNHNINTLEEEDFSYMRRLK